MDGKSGGITTAALTGSIAELIGRMEALLADLETRGDGKRYFLSTYLRTTRAMAEELRAGGFLDPAWVERWDVVFAGRYLDALETWNRGENPPVPWRVAFEAASDPSLPALRHTLLGMNAHINYDLPLALLAVISDGDFRDPTILDRRSRDHQHVNAVLLRRVAAEDEAITTAQGGQSLLDRVKDPLERWGTGHFLQEARAKVWANVRLLATARARGDRSEYERLQAELSRRSAEKLHQLVGAREVLLQLSLKGFGVLLEGAHASPA